MKNGIKEKDIRDMQKCLDKMDDILNRIREYNSKAKLICIDSDTIALVNFGDDSVNCAPDIKDEYIVAEKWISNLDNYC